MKKILRIAGAILLALLLLAGGLFGYIFYKQRAYAALTDSADLNIRIEKMIGEYVSRKPYAAVSVGVIQGEKVWTKGFGTVAATKAPPNEKSIYEIGSITKVFTGVVLASLKQQGLVKSGEKIGPLLPKEAQLPDGAGSKINLRHLATHTAGLPRLPDNLFNVAKDQSNPYKNYTTNHLYEALNKLKLESAPGEKVSYSNFGSGLLGHLLELKSGKSYAELVRENITSPLGMNDTKLELTAADKARLIPGYSAKGKPVSNWDFQVLAPAGGLKSTVADLLLFIKANFTNDTQLGKALKDSRQIRVSKSSGTVGLGWHVLRTIEGASFWWHNGGTGGYATFLGIDPKKKLGIVILSNSGDAFAGDNSVDKMAVEILKLSTKISLPENKGATL